VSSLRVIPRSALHLRTYDERPNWVNDRDIESSGRDQVLTHLRGSARYPVPGY
jgi:hypothetical protein